MSLKALIIGWRMGIMSKNLDISKREAIESEYRALSNAFMSNKLSKVNVERMCDLEAIMNEWYS